MILLRNIQQQINVGHCFASPRGGPKKTRGLCSVVSILIFICWTPKTKLASRAELRRALRAQTSDKQNNDNDKTCGAHECTQAPPPLPASPLRRATSAGVGSLSCNARGVQAAGVYTWAFKCRTCVDKFVDNFVDKFADMFVDTFVDKFVVTFVDTCLDTFAHRFANLKRS